MRLQRQHHNFKTRWTGEGVGVMGRNAFNLPDCIAVRLKIAILICMDYSVRIKDVPCISRSTPDVGGVCPASDFGAKGRTFQTSANGSPSSHTQILLDFKRFFVRGSSRSCLRWHRDRLITTSLGTTSFDSVVAELIATTPSSVRVTHSLPLIALRI